MIAAYEIVFNFVVSAERLDVAEQILALPKLQRWTAVFPVCESRLRQLADRLAQEKLQARQTAAGPNLSRPSSSPDTTPDLGGGGGGGADDGGESEARPRAGRQPAADDRGGDTSGGGDGPDWSSYSYSAGKLADMVASSWGLEGDLDLAWLQWLN